LNKPARGLYFSQTKVLVKGLFLEQQTKASFKILTDRTFLNMNRWRYSHSAGEAWSVHDRTLLPLNLLPNKKAVALKKV